MSKYIALPKGVAEADFDKAIAEFKKILGAGNVLHTRERLAPYLKIMIPAPIEEHTPSAAIMPESVEQIQRILRVCNRYKTPVWPISTGKNFGYGSAAPATRGQIVLDLKRLNRIIEVDPDLCFAVVEPGVTYQQLYDYIKERKLPLWLDPPIPGPVASPLGNTVERGVGYTPYGEHFLFSCGMEVALANGDILRTGMGSMPNSNTWQVFKWGYGPSLDGIFTQSNFGIVTKLGIWLMPAPPAYKPFVVRYPDPTDIVKAIETVRPLRIAQVIPNAGTVSNALWELAVVNRREDLYTGAGAIPEATVAKLAKAHGVGSWNVYTALYGTEETIADHWKIVTAAFKASGGTVLTQEYVGPDDPLFNYRRDVMRGEMTMREFGLYNWRGGGGSMWFAPVSQARGSETMKQMGLAKKVLNKYGIDYVGLFVIGWRDMHHIIDILYDRTLPAEMEKARSCYSELLDDFAREGYGVYRTNIDFMDKVAKLYGPVKASVNHKIKKALDPNGILAPGKSGIHR